MDITTDDDPLAVRRRVVTPENRDLIADVLADPANAWRRQPHTRKVEHLRQRGIAVADDAATDGVDERLERVMGEDDLVLSRWLEAGTQVADAVALIRQPAPATGFLVSDWLLLTNHHVLDSPDTAADCEVLFRYSETEDGAVVPVRSSCDPGRCFVTSGVDDLDFSLVALVPTDGSPPGHRFGHIPLIGSVGKAIAGQPLNIVQHPGGQSRRVAFRNNRLLAVDDRRLVYETDTKPGSSGSPVLNDRWQLVALHHASQEAKNDDGVEIDANGRPVTASTPDHLRRWVANAGIRVSRIVADLRDRALTPPVRTLVDDALRGGDR